MTTSHVGRGSHSEQSAKRDVEASARSRVERAVQFGTGAFLRGFIDDFLDRANEQGLFNGSIVAIGSTGSGRDEALCEQNGRYTLVERGVENGAVVDRRRVVTSLSRALSAATEWDEVLTLARSPELQFVFSNTTEVGIALSETDAFDDAPPTSFPAKLARFLFERARAFDFNEHGVVVLPCELIENNGAVLHDIVQKLAMRWKLDARFAEWLNANVRFCNTLVDRIVPGTPRAADAEQLRADIGYDDKLITCCEPYRLFAIEGDAQLEHALPWVKADDNIIIAADIAPYRARKLYILNGAHTAFVHIALLYGASTVREAMEMPELEAFVKRAVYDEIVTSLDVSGAMEFADAVLDRFRNPFIEHALLDITLQATMKMRHRIVPSILRYVEQRGELPPSLMFSFAALLHYKRVTPLSSQRADANGEALIAAAERLGEDIDAFARDVCANTEIWGADLSAIPNFVEVVVTHMRALHDHGVQALLPTHAIHVR